MPGGSSRCSRSSVCPRSCVYSTWAAFQGNHYAYGPYLSPFYSPVLFGDAPHAWFGPKPGWWPVAAVLAGAADPLGAGRIPLHLLLLPRRVLQGLLGRSAVVHRRRAAQVVSRRAFVPADPSERPPVLSLSRAPLPRRAHATTCGRRCGSPIRRPGTDSFGIGLGTLVLAVNVVLLGGYTFGCHSLRHLVGGVRDEISKSPLVRRELQVRERLNRRHMLLGLDEPVLRRVLPTSTCACVRWASGTTSESSEPGSSPARIGSARFPHGLRHTRIRRARDRRRRRGSARRHRSVGRGRHGRPGLQVAARQGAHRHGRGRHRRGARQRGRSRQLEGPFRRHDARRPVRQQLAHGGAARAGSARPRARARGVGRGLRPHDGRPDPAAQLRRPSLSAPRPRRRSHRARDDPHAPGPRHPSRHRRPHGVHGPDAAQGRRADRRASSATSASVDASRSSRARPRSCWRPAASAAPTRSRATAGSTPATGTRWRTTRGPSSSTWSSCSSIRRAWSGRRACRGSW